MSYQFKGYDWTELAECWGITVEPQRVDFTKDWDVENEDDWKLPEQIDVTHTINRMKIVFTIREEEEVLAEKVKRHISKELISSDNQSVREDINRFLKVLIDESESGECANYNHPVYKGIMAIEDNFTFGQWIVRNLENLWT